MIGLPNERSEPFNAQMDIRDDGRGSVLADSLVGPEDRPELIASIAPDAMQERRQ